MGGTSRSARCVCNDFSQKVGGRLRCLPGAEHRRQSPVGREHDFLRILSFYVCESHLVGDSCFCDCDEEASWFCLRCRLLRGCFRMRKVNLKDVPEVERKSPKGRFVRFTKNISVALGREPESLDLSKRHPFDLALV